MLNVLLVGLGGFVGSVARYIIYLLIRTHFNHPFPIATLLVNTVGCFTIGALFAFVEQGSISLNPRVTLLLSTGIIGGFTTFSAFGIETFELIRLQQHGFAVLNILGNLVFGLGAVATGRVLIASIMWFV